MVSFILITIVISVLTVVYFFLSSEAAKALVLSLLALTVISGGGFLYWSFRQSGPEQLGKRLREAESLGTLDELKKNYGEIYELYLKLSEREKQNFYARVGQRRGSIEEQLRAAKKVEELLPQAEEGSLKERKDSYDQLYQHFQKLPEGEKEKYYPQIVHLRSRLEKGS